MKQFELNAATRLTQVLAREDVDPSEWWTHLPAEQKKQYIKEHPDSKYAKEHIKDVEDKADDGADKVEDDILGKEFTPEHRKKVADQVKKAAPRIAKILKGTFPRITEATSALKHILTGRTLTHEHREVLHELGDVALKSALSTTVGPHGAMLLSRVGTTAVRHAIEHFKKRKEADKSKDDVELFVETVAEGVEHAKETKAPTRISTSEISKHLKGQAHHIVSVLHKSFPHVKPATQGLVALSKGQALTEEHKKAVKGLGKVALGLSIAALPGGLVAHLVAGVGATALGHAYRAIRKQPVEPKHILHSFVEAIGEGLEDALLEKAAGEE